MCINPFWNWFRLFSFFLSLSCDKSISFLFAQFHSVYYFVVYLTYLYYTILYTNFFFFIFARWIFFLYDYEKFFKNYKIHILIYAYMLSLWSFANLRNSCETPCCVFDFFSLSCTGLFLYWDHGSVKNSNLNGLFTPSYWFWTSVFKSRMCYPFDYRATYSAVK